MSPSSACHWAFATKPGKVTTQPAVISTQSSERDRARSLVLGADDFLPKPFTPEALCAAASKSLAARRAQHPAEGSGP